MVRSRGTDSPQPSTVQIGPASRLPWLDEVSPERSSLRRNAGWLVAGALAVIGGAYFLAIERLHQAPQPSASVSTTPLAPQTEAPAAPPAGTSPSGRPAVRLELPKAVPVPRSSSPSASAGKPSKAAAAPSAPASTRVSESASASAPAASKASEAAAKAAPPSVKAARTAAAKVPSSGARPGAVFPMTGSGAAVRSAAALPQPGPASALNGHVVQLGAFSTVEQAKPVWRAMERSYPPLKQFNASLIENRDWNGRLFYQFQVGTASQADSEMLCQSLQRLNFRCAVVASPWSS